jgi:hypothetical protein
MLAAMKQENAERDTWPRKEQACPASCRSLAVARPGVTPIVIARRFAGGRATRLLPEVKLTRVRDEGSSYKHLPLLMSTDCNAALADIMGHCSA